MDGQTIAIELLDIAGFAFIGLIVLMFSVLIHDYIVDAIEHAKYKYKYKHRFDKPPTAKCYCKDCAKWNPENETCGDFYNNRKMADNWFCCFASPMSSKELADRRREMDDK